MYLPCFLSLYGILPEWRYYREKPGIQRLIIGLSCVTTGLVFSTVHFALNLDSFMLVALHKGGLVVEFVYIHSVGVFDTFLEHISVFNNIVGE